MTPRSALLALVAVLAVACGGESPSSPSPVPAPTPALAPAPSKVTITVAITDTVSGASIGTTTQEVASLPATITVSAAGHYDRTTRVTSSTPTIDLIPSAAPFSLDFYRQLTRDAFDDPGAMERLAILPSSPLIYLQTSGLSASVVSRFEATARAIVPALTGGRLNVAAFESGSSSRSPSNGWIVIDIVNDPAKHCGETIIGALAGHMWLNTRAGCGQDGEPVSGTAVFAHELGHALGFYHVSDPTALMYTPAIPPSATPNAAERYHGAIAYHRSRGNRDIDVD